MLQKKIKIINKLGLHARAAATMVSRASRYASSIEVINGNKRASAKSIMGVMLLAATNGTEIELIVSGNDEIEAMADIVALINNRFGESE